MTNGEGIGERLRAEGFDVAATAHAASILRHEFAAEAEELAEALLSFRIPVTELIGSGGGEAASTQRLRRTLAVRGWRKHRFDVDLMIDGRPFESTSHEIDHVRRAPAGVLALEIEWNNKDPFFDRDLESFQRLHRLSAISVGIVVTRGRTMQGSLIGRVESFSGDHGIDSADDLRRFGMKPRTDRQTAAVARLVARGMPFASAFARTFIADKFGEATTHWRKLEERVGRGVGAPCPLFLIGLPASASQ